MKPPLWPLESLLELIYPERCALCGTGPGEVPWVPRGAMVAGMRFWDGTHLCLKCEEGLGAGPVRGRVSGGLPVIAAAPTNGDMVKLIGRLKYHGQRGLAWPLAEMLRKPLTAAISFAGTVDALTPVALHPRRRRLRGFNQSEILARLLTAGTSVPVLTDILVRHRHSTQQAKILSTRDRRFNVADSFKAPAPGETGAAIPVGAKRIGLLDDLVTSGFTAASAAESMKAVGWDVRWVLAVGLAADAKKSSRRVDTWEGGF